MMYTKQQVKIARDNTDLLKDCPRWLQDIFNRAPYHKTMAQYGICSFGSGYDGTSTDMIYRISSEWPPESEILPKCISKLETTEMLR